MRGDRGKGRRAFRPTPEIALETRWLLSGLPQSFFLKHTKPGFAYVHNQPRFTSPAAKPFFVSQAPHAATVRGETAHGGESVIVGTPDGSHFKIQLTQFIPPAGEGQTSTGSGANVPGQQNPIQGQIPGGGVVQPIGTIRAYAMSGGRVGLIVDGSTTQTELDISPLPFPQQKSYAHSFAYGQTGESHILNVGQLTVNTGVIGAILAYHTADLSGPLTVAGGSTVDRIAFQALLPGATITTGSDLNTLDVLNQADLSGAGTGIHIGRDLNLINVGEDLTITNGATLTVGRFLGTTPQPPKGTATGSNILAVNQALVGTGTSTVVPSVSGYILGNLIIGPGSTFTVVSGIANTSASSNGSVSSPSVFLVNGSVQIGAASQLNIPGIVPANQVGAQVANPNPPPLQLTANFVARNGLFINGVNIF